MTGKSLELERPGRDLVRRIPKVLLHEHLDGGLRPATVLELARAAGYEGLPADEVEPLAAWFFAGASRGTLPLYLEGFRHTIAVMQTAEALERVAYEFIEDMAAENVVYAEVRFAPHFHTAGGLGLDAVMSAVLSGLRRGREDFGVDNGLIVCAMRNESAELALKLAELAVAYRERGCVGFDLAGEEAGHPAKEHLKAFHYCLRMNFSITIHAGESFGPESIWQALQYCGAHRLGHGTRLIEDIVVYEGKVIKLGSLAQYVLDKRIPIEVCLSSNVHTGAAPSLAEDGAGVAVALPQAWVQSFTAEVTLTPRLSIGTAAPESIYEVRFVGKILAVPPAARPGIQAGDCEIELPLPPQIISLADLSIKAASQPSDRVVLRDGKLVWRGPLPTEPTCSMVWLSIPSRMRCKSLVST